MISNDVDQLELLKLIFENSQSLLFVKNSESKFIAANNAFARSYNIPLDQVLNFTNAEINKNPDELTKFQIHDQNTIKNNKVITEEEIVRNPLGEPRFYRTTKIPLKDKKGESFILGISEDITDLKSLKNNYSENEKKLKIFFENSPLALSMASEQGYFLEVNQAFISLFGYNKKEILNLTIADITPAQYRAENIDSLVKLRNQELDSFTIDKQLIHKNKSLIPVRVTVKYSAPSEFESCGFFFAIIEDLRTMCFASCVNDCEFLKATLKA